MSTAPHRNARSWVALVGGAISLGTGLAWMLAAGWGVAPLDAFIAGTAELVGLTIGTTIVLISLMFLVGAWVLGSRPGWGTLIAFVGVGVVVDGWILLVFDLLGWTPSESSVYLRVALWVVGFTLFAGGVLATLASDLGANPYDQIIRAAHERFGIPIWVSRLIFDGIVLGIAFLLGGAWGAGTLAILILMPFVMGILMPRFRNWVHHVKPAIDVAGDPI